ncbi:MAG: ferrochelatase [Bacteroidota bacterium]
MPKKGILLVNLGTPDSTDVKDVRKYLREFLMDKRVVDIPFIGRWLLVNGIIAPFRAPKSAAEYRKLFDERGSPLKYYTEDITGLLQEKLNKDYSVKFAMRYQNPSIESVLEEFKKEKIVSLHVIPLFPQYASATTGSVVDKVMELTKEWQIIPHIKFTSQFLEDELFIDTIVDQGKKLMSDSEYDHFIFSYHGLPERQIRKGSNGNYCQLGTCCNLLNENNRYCYRAQCFETTRLITKKLDIKKEDYTVCFQSRLGKTPWVQPYTEDVLEDLAKKGIKKVLAFSPAFVSDCLETTIEVGETYQEDFIHAGGEKWDLVPSLNAEDKWVECLKEMVVN